MSDSLEISRKERKRKWDFENNQKRNLKQITLKWDLDKIREEKEYKRICVLAKEQDPNESKAGYVKHYLRTHGVFDFAPSCISPRQEQLLDNTFEELEAITCQLLEVEKTISTLQKIRVPKLNTIITKLQRICDQTRAFLDKHS